jgi:hypothetical protein
MLSPDDYDKPFIARWNVLSRILIVDPSVKLVMRAAMDYADFQEGTNCHPSNERIARENGLGEKTVRNAWAIMRGTGMAHRVGDAVAHRRLADEYTLQIPPNWQGLPVLGPHAGKFTCPHCRKLFNPNGSWTINGPKDGDKPDTIRFKLREMSFCPKPREREGHRRPSCFAQWDASQVKAGRPQWHQLGQDAWKVFNEARGDEW